MAPPVQPHTDQHWSPCPAQRSLARTGPSWQTAPGLRQSCQTLLGARPASRAPLGAGVHAAEEARPLTPAGVRGVKVHCSPGTSHREFPPKAMAAALNTESEGTRVGRFLDTRSAKRFRGIFHLTPTCPALVTQHRMLHQQPPMLASQCPAGLPPPTLLLTHSLGD